MIDDATQIQNSLSNERFVPNDYSDVQWQYLQDSNNGGYGNVIQFFTTVTKSQFTDLCNAYIRMPISIYSSGTDYDGSEAIAFRDSILQLCNQITVSTDTGMTLFSELMAPYYINALRLRIEQSMEFFNVMGDQLQMANCIDKWMNSESTTEGLKPFTPITEYCVSNWNTGNHGIYEAGVMNNPYKYYKGTPTTPPVATADNTGVVLGDNPYCNEGFRQRIGIFKNTFSFNPTTKAYDGIVMLPLALIHDFFKEVNFVFFNIGLNIQIYLTQPHEQSTNYPVLMSANNLAGNVIPLPRIRYGGALNGLAKGETCKLYYRSVLFNVKDTAIMEANLKSNNFVKSVNFVSTEFIMDRSTQGTVFTGDTNTEEKQYFSQEIATSCVYPLRIWILIYPTAALAGTDPASHQWPFTGCPFYIDDLNVTINNNPYLKLPLKFHQDQWNQIADQFKSDDGSILTHADHRRFFKVGLIDVTRLGLTRLTSPTEPCSLTITGNITKPIGVGYKNAKVVFLIEKMNEITFRFSQTETTMVVGNISLNNTAA